MTMENIEIAFTQTGVVKRRVTEEAITEAVVDLIVNQIARDVAVFTPNLIDAGDYFSALHGISNQAKSTWFAAKVKKLKFNGQWVVEAERLFPGRDGEVPFPDASELVVDVPIPLFVFICPAESRLFMLTFQVSELEDGVTRKTWARLPFPNTYNDGALCSGLLPAYDHGLSVTTNAMRMLGAWIENPWNEDLYSEDTQDFLARIASFSLPDGGKIASSAQDWSRYAVAVNPGVEAINSAFEPLVALYGKEAGDAPRS